MKYFKKIKPYIEKADKATLDFLQETLRPGIVNNPTYLKARKKIKRGVGTVTGRNKEITDKLLNTPTRWHSRDRVEAISDIVDKRTNKAQRIALLTSAGLAVGAGAGALKGKSKKEKQALRNIVEAHPNLDISFKGYNK
jgi:hypothetical protein